MTAIIDKLTSRAGAVFNLIWHFAMMCSAATIFIIAFFANRGFDFTDEGYYYLNFLHPSEVPIGATAFHHIGGYIFKVVGYDIHLLRLSVLAGMVASGCFFCIAFYRLMKQQYDISPLSLGDKIAISVLLVLSNLSIYSIFPISWSYNQLNIVAMTIVYSIFLLIITQTENTKLSKIIGLYILCTAFIVLDFFVKFSSSLSMFGVLEMLLLLVPNVSWRNKGIIAFSIFSAIALFMMIYFTFIQSFAEAYRNVMEIAAAAKLGGTGAESLSRYGREMKSFLASIFTHYWKPITLMVVGNAALFFAKRYKNIRSVVFAWNGLVWLIFLVLVYKEGLYKNTVWITVTGATLRFYMTITILLGLQLLGSLMILGKISSKQRVLSKKLLILLLFLSFPFIGAVGTANPIFLNAFNNIITLFAIYVILLYELSLLWDYFGILKIGTLVLTVFICSHIICGYVIKPYGNVYYPQSLAVPLYKQTIPTSFGVPESKLFFDELNHRFIEDIRAIMQKGGFKVGDDIIGLFDMPGLVFAIGGNSIGRPWYLSSPPQQMELNVHYLQTTDQRRIKSAFIMIKGDQRIGRGVLRKAGIEFPEKYLLIGTSITPYTNEPIYFWKSIARE